MIVGTAFQRFQRLAAPVPAHRARTRQRYAGIQARPSAQYLTAFHRESFPLPSRCCSSVQASSTSQPTSSPSSPFSPGFACLPGVSSPTHFRAFWLRVARQRVEQLMRAAADAPAASSVLLPVLDELVFELKQVAMPALHCADHHRDPEWRAAGAEVYSACHKYEQYILRHQGLHRKLCEVHRQLSNMPSEQGQQNGGVSKGRGTGSAGAADLSGDRATSGHARVLVQRSLRDGGQELHLAQALLQLFERRGGAAVQDAFSTSHYVLPHLPDTEDPAWQGCMNAVRAERELALRVRASVASASKSPVLPLVLVDREGSTNEVSGHAQDEHQAPWASDPILQPLLRRTPRLHTFMGEVGSRKQEPGNINKGQAAAGWGAVLLLDSVAVSQVLSHHPNPSLREAVYTAGLEARIDVVLHLRSQMADARAAIARANQAPSFAHLMLEPKPLHLSPSGQAKLRSQHSTDHPAMDKRPDSNSGPPHCPTQRASTQPMPGRVEGAGRLLHACAQAVRRPVDEQLQHMTACPSPVPPAAPATPPLHPWDVAYAQQQLLHAQGLDVCYEDVKEYLNLQGLVEGLGSVLEQSMGLRVRILPSTPILGADSDAGNLDGGSIDGDMWAPGMTRLGLESVSSHDLSRDSGIHGFRDTGDAGSTLLGICYLDPGGGYGTRQLRCARQARSCLSSPSQQSLPAQQQQDPGWERLPVVSVGLQQPWNDGYAGRLEAVLELLHELGHAVHLIASSHAAPYKLLGGLHLPLELLEVPSILFERFAMDHRTLQAVCRTPSGSQGETCSSASGMMDDTTAKRLATQFKARHSNALDLQEQVLVALGDHELNAARASSPDQKASDAASSFDALWEAYSSLPQASASLKQLSSLPVACHHQATFWVYICAWCCACGLWESYLAADPLGVSQEGAASGRALRRALLEARPGDCFSTAPASDIPQSNHTSHELGREHGAELGVGYALQLATPRNLRRWLFHGESSRPGEAGRPS